MSPPSPFEGRGELRFEEVNGGDTTVPDLLSSTCRPFRPLTAWHGAGLIVPSVKRPAGRLPRPKGRRRIAQTRELTSDGQTWDERAAAALHTWTGLGRGMAFDKGAAAAPMFLG